MWVIQIEHIYVYIYMYIDTLCIYICTPLIYMYREIMESRSYYSGWAKGSGTSTTYLESSH